VVTLVAKSHDRHVQLALRTTLAENLAMIADTVGHLRGEGRRVFLDAEHFFDGYRSDPAYALEVVRTAVEAGADLVALCDTNGGMLPTEIGDVVAAVADTTGARLGIHCHDDTACAVANTLTAVSAGATHVQGTANGYGERAGTPTCSPSSEPRDQARHAHAPHDALAERPGPRTRWRNRQHRPGTTRHVGVAAFAHKAGLHASAIKVDRLYNHMDPVDVGNGQRVLVWRWPAGPASSSRVSARPGPGPPSRQL
jgi:2-isopropylmalate synthase